MRVLVTGGAGYAGSHICKLLRKKGIPHLVYDDLSTGHEAHIAGSPFVRGDIGNGTLLDSTFSDFRPDTVLHLAALATLGDCAARPDDCRRINVEGTRALLEAMRTHRVHTMVFAGSCAVYANVPTGQTLREDSMAGPGSHYGKSKLAAEALLAEYREKHGLRAVTLRMFNAAGADPEGAIGEDHSPETHLLPLCIMAALGRRAALDIFGHDYPTDDGTAVRDYVHVSDIAEAFLLAATYVKNGGTAAEFNLGSGVPTSVRQLLGAVERHTGKKIPAREKPRRQGDAPWLVADNGLLRETLGWQPKHSSLDSIVETALRWHRK